MSSRLQAVLFDMDGLLVDTEPLWTVAEGELAARYGARLTVAAKAAVIGTRLDVAVPTLLGLFGAPVTPGEVARASAFLLDRMATLLAEPFGLRPGAGELLAALTAEGIPTALVSSSYRLLVDTVLAGRVWPFAITVAGDEVAHGKPHPLPYLMAAGRLGVDPRQCVVLEDSPAGAASGLAAGCAVLAVPSVAGAGLAPAARLRVVDSLCHADIENLAALLRDPAA